MFQVFFDTHQKIDIRDALKVQINGGRGIFKASIQLIEKNQDNLHLATVSPTKNRGRTLKELYYLTFFHRLLFLQAAIIIPLWSLLMEERCLYPGMIYFLDDLLDVEYTS
jgi:hypothetical protein